MTSSQAAELVKFEEEQKALGRIFFWTRIWNQNYTQLKQADKFELARNMIRNQIAYQKDVLLPRMRIAKVALSVGLLILLLILIVRLFWR